MQWTSGPDGFITTSDIGDYSDQALLTEYLHSVRSMAMRYWREYFRSFANSFPSVSRSPLFV